MDFKSIENASSSKGGFGEPLERNLTPVITDLQTGADEEKVSQNNAREKTSEFKPALNSDLTGIK
jgi:hypothetical protein